jgi:hypothetical protein
VTFLYKIYSGYDGFYPRKIPSRLVRGKFLHLGWDRYIEAVEVGNEVWVFFHGPHAFENGVYVKGYVHSIDAGHGSVLLRVRSHSTETPLINRETSDRVSQIVRPRFRQVFLLPYEWESTPNCSIGTTAESCRLRQCERCAAWGALPRIQPTELGTPVRLPSDVGFAPAYWVIPSRCYLGRGAGRLVRRTSEIFYRFKIGEEALAYPLALAMFRALTSRGLIDFDAVVPIQLSPEKAERGELNRMRALAGELSKLLGVPVLEALSLERPCSKKAALAKGATPSGFEREYMSALVRREMAIPDRILLIDDVCTRGSTLRSACAKLREANEACVITVATAGQMILKEVVRDEAVLVADEVSAARPA